ncbi:protein FADD [Gadus chalcogrammus]|uniref:protein FADD n=1 Tax=Gadus chalcogrammus TaxID=1042646 RepID=UPI0024C4D509|nr:protein FADD [Gadus chalcogrammus]
MSGDPFKQKLLQVSNQLTESQLKDLTFLCGFIGKARLEKITQGYELFEVLIERKKIQHDDAVFLSDLLTQVGRSDLSDLFTTGNLGPTAGPNDPRDAEGVNINLAAEVIADHLGRNWRKLARKLGLSEVKIKSIERRGQQMDLEELAMEVVREWRSTRRGEAKAEHLLVALRACEMNLTAEKVEERLREASEQ